MARALPHHQNHSHAAIKLQLSSREKKIHPVVSITNVHKHTPDEIIEHPQPPQPGPAIVEGHKEYEVKNILDSKLIQCQLHYYMKWKGYPNSDNCWIPYHDIQHSPTLLHDFHICYPFAPGPQSVSATPRCSGLRGG